MFKVMVDKDIMLMQINKIVEKLEKSDGKNLESINDELLDIAMSNKKEFQDIVKLEAIKNLDETIEKMELQKKSNEEKISLSSIIEDFIPKNINDTYFKSKREELGTLEELKYHSSNFTNEIASDVDKKMQELIKDKEIDLDERKLLELKCFMEFGMKKIVNDEIENASNDIRFLTDIDNYKIDKENISRGDLKAIRNSIVEREDYSNEEIKRDILITKVLEKDIENKEELEKIQNEILNLKEYNCKEELSRYMIDNTVKKLLFNETTYEERQNLDFNNEFKAKIKDEINNSFNFLVKNETNNNFLMNILEDWQSGCPNLLFNHYPSYKIILDDMEIELEDKETFDIFKHSVLLVPEDKEKYWEFMNKLGYTDINEEKDFKEVKGINFNGQEEIIREKIIEIKGQEYWDNMDINNIEDWQKLQEDDIVDISYKIVHYDKKEETEYKKFENKEKTEKESYEKMFLEYFDILSNRLIFRETMKEKEYLEIEKLRDGKELNDNYKKMSLSSFENSDRIYSNKLKTDIEYNEKMIKKFNEKLIEDENYEKTLIELNKDFNEKNEAKEILKRDEKVLEKAKTEKEIDL